MIKRFKSLLSGTLIVALLISNLMLLNVKVQAESNDSSINTTLTQDLSQNTSLLEVSYSEKLQEWSEVPEATDYNMKVVPSSDPVNKSVLVSRSDSYGYSDDTIRWNEGAIATIQVTVPKTALYQLSFDYFVLDDSILTNEGYLLVNDQYPYYESRRILFPNLWENEPLKEKWDRYGNELLPRPVKVKTWQTVRAIDASYFHVEPLKFKLEQGVNTLQLVNSRGDMLLGNAVVESPLHIQSYEEYVKLQPADTSKGKKLDTLLITEAEQMTYKSDSSIRAMSDTDSNMTPYDTERMLLNAIAAFSWEEGGQSIAWDIEAPQSGYYYVAFKYLQSFQYDLPAFRRIEIDGKVPFSELDNYRFPYTKKWKNETLSQGSEPFRIYLEQGKHNLKMTVNLSGFRPLVEDILKTMREISQLTLEIKKLTGNRSDQYRDWDLHEYIPGLDRTLNDWAVALEQRYKEINEWNPSVDGVSEVVNLKLAAKQLRKLAKDPDELPNQLNLFSEGSSSASQLLGTLLQSVSESPLALDRIYLYQDGELPSANAGFFENLWEGIKRFILSFKTKSYSSAEETEELEVWVNRSRPFVELMQKMIDENYTPESGVSVKLSIMPDQNKLVLANASNAEPDVALGVDNWIPYELAIRGASLDLRTLKGFDEMMSHFSKGALIPFSFEEGVYAIPETQDFWVLFYRQDILDSLKLSPPDTWNDVVEMLPELQRLGMNFYEPLALYKGFKPFSATTPFIYQFNGELFDEGGMTTAIDSEASLEGIKFMTDLYTIYNLPQDVPNFYHHFRYGTMPIGISNFNTYIQLKAAAPEIANWWRIAPHPGVQQDDGTIARWAPSGGQTGMIFSQTDKQEESWDFLKWWMSTEIQVQFGNLMQTTFGMTYMWNTANLDAIVEAPWPEEDKKVILEQMKWAREASRVPGAYMVEREISNVWNRVVFNGANPRTAIDDAVIRTDREIIRKMEEFGYVKNGIILKPYPVPTINTIDKWVER